jgi:hypothetical protein
LVNSDDKLTIFFTLNGLLAGWVLIVLLTSPNKKYLFFRSPISNWADSGSPGPNCHIVGWYVCGGQFWRQSNQTLWIRHQKMPGNGIGMDLRRMNGIWIQWIYLTMDSCLDFIHSF